MKYEIADTLINDFSIGEPLKSAIILGQSRSGKGNILQKFCQDIIRLNSEENYKFLILQDKNSNWNRIIPSKYILNLHTYPMDFLSEIWDLLTSRIELLKRFGCSSIYDFNNKVEYKTLQQPKIFIIIDDYYRHFYGEEDKQLNDLVYDLYTKGYNYNLIPIISTNILKGISYTNPTLSVCMRFEESVSEMFTEEEINKNDLKLYNFPGEYIAKYGDTFLKYSPKILLNSKHIST